MRSLDQVVLSNDIFYGNDSNKSPLGPRSLISNRLYRHLRY